MLREPGLLRSALITVHDLAHVHAARTPGSLRSVLVTALDLAHVHAAPANSALFLPEVSLFAFVFGGQLGAFAHTVAHAARTWLAPLGVGHGT